VDVGHEVASPDATLAGIKTNTTQSDIGEDVTEWPGLVIDLVDGKVEGL